MKRVILYSPIFYLFILLFWSCSNDNNQLDENEKYSTLLAKVSKLEEVHKIDSAFYLINNYSTNEDVPLYYQNKAKLELSRLYQKQGDFIESEAIIVDVLKNNSDSLLEPYIHNDLGIIFKEQKQFEKSLLHYSIAKEKSSLELHKAIIENNIGVVHLEEEQYSKAVDNLTPLLNNEALKEYPFFFVKAVDNLGYAYLNLAILQKADSLLHRGYEIRDSINDDQGKIASTVHLSKLFVKQKDTLKAIAYAKEAYEIATSINSPNDRIEALDLLIRLDNQKDWYTQLAFIQDSITNVRQNNKNQFAKIRYDNTKTLEQLTKEKNQKIILITVLLFLIILGHLLFRFLKLKSKKEQLQAIYNTETKISKKVHDELANDIFQTLNYVEIKDQNETLYKENLLDKLENIYEKSRSISRENNVIDTGENFNLEITNLINGFNTSEIQIITKGLKNANWDKLNQEKKIALYRCLQELLINMKKHSEASLVLISFENTSSNLKFSFKDNGKGLVNEFKIKNGLSNVENRIENISGTCTFESDNGFKVQINIPF